MKKNAAIVRKKKGPVATNSQFKLFQKYVNFRHSEGGMASMDFIEFSSMIEETSVETILCEYYLNKDDLSEQLIAVSLTDVLSDGLSMVYSFYDTALVNHSLGKFMILDHINLASEMLFDYLYLGYWVSGSNKMDYKAQYQPLEVFKNGDWLILDQFKAPKKASYKPLIKLAENSDTIYLPESKINE
jgi:arginine-tRNA-protein transferase